MRASVSVIARKTLPVTPIRVGEDSERRKLRVCEHAGCRLRAVSPRGVIVSAPFSLLNEDGSCAPEHARLISDEDLAAVLDGLVLNRILDRRC